MDWIEFIAALAAFFIAHWAPLRPGLRAPLKRVLGQTGFTWIYSVLSLGLLAWLIMATNRAPRLMIWPWAPWQNLLVLGAMAAAVLILALTLGRPNPFSFGGGGGPAPFDPTRPGLPESSAGGRGSGGAGRSRPGDGLLAPPAPRLTPRPM